MYKNRPSKEQQKKGLKIIKELIMSQKKITQLNQSNLTTSKDQIWSSTSFKELMKEEINKSTSRVQKKLFESNNLQVSRNKNNPQNLIMTMGNKETIASSKTSINESKMTKMKPKEYTTESRLKTQTKQKINNLHLHNTTSRLINQPHPNQPSNRQLFSLTIPLQVTKSLSKEKKPLTSSCHFKQQLNLPLKIRSSSFIQIPKLAPHYRLAKQKATLQNLQILQKLLLFEREQIKKVRKEFVQVLENGKKFMVRFEKQTKDNDKKNQDIQEKFKDFDEKANQRHFHIKQLVKQVQFQQLNLSEQNSTLSSQKYSLKQKILFQQQQNSTLARKIYHLKTHLVSLNQQKYHCNTLSNHNRSLIQKIIQKQQAINDLKVQKSIVLHGKKQLMKEQIKEELEKEDKRQVYERLDKEINLVKEYFKISENAKQFKRNIKKLTKFTTFHKDIEYFTKSFGYSQQLMQIYKKNLWNTQMPKFFESQPLILESPKIRQLKNNFKQLEMKRQSLNSCLKEKEKFVESLSYRLEKLIEQIENLRRKNEMDHNQEGIKMERGSRVGQMDLLIDWGF